MVSGRTAKLFACPVCRTSVAYCANDSVTIDGINNEHFSKSIEVFELSIISIPVFEI